MKFDFLKWMSIISFSGLVACGTAEMNRVAVSETDIPEYAKPSPALLPLPINQIQHIVVVHGIGAAKNWDKGYAIKEGFIEALANRTGLVIDVSSLELDNLNVKSLPISMTESLHEATLGKEIFEAYKNNWPSYVSYPFKDKQGQTKVLLHEFSWAKLSELVANCHISSRTEDRMEVSESVNQSLSKLTQKGGLTGCAQTKSWHSKSAVLNNEMSNFVRTHLTDVLIYDGDFGSVIRDALGELLVNELAADLLNPAVSHTNVAFVTHSLGSKLVVDTFREDSNAFTQPYEKLQGKTLNDHHQKFRVIPVYMLANQLTLLRLNNLCTGPRCGRGIDRQDGPRKTSSEVSKHLKTVLTPQLVMHSKPQPFRLDLIAYNDPNDVLSFEIPKNTPLGNIAPNAEIRAWNIRVGTTNSVWSLGLLAWPKSAHNNYWTDGVVLSSMLCGASPIYAGETTRTKCASTEPSSIQPLKIFSP